LSCKEVEYYFSKSIEEDEKTNNDDDENTVPVNQRHAQLQKLDADQNPKFRLLNKIEQNLNSGLAMLIDFGIAKNYAVSVQLEVANDDDDVSTVPVNQRHVQLQKVDADQNPEFRLLDEIEQNLKSGFRC